MIPDSSIESSLDFVRCLPCDIHQLLSLPRPVGVLAHLYVPLDPKSQPHSDVSVHLLHTPAAALWPASPEANHGMQTNNL